MWLFILIVLVYCFTVGLTAKYKEQATEEREIRIKQKIDFDEEILKLLRKNETLKLRIEEISYVRQ